MVGPAMNRLTRELDLTTLLDMDMASISGSVLVGLVGVCIVNDYLRRKRVHSAYLTGLAGMLGVPALSGVVPDCDVWRALAT